MGIYTPLEEILMALIFANLNPQVKCLIFSNIKEYYQWVKNPKRTTLLINLSVEEADQIRAAAKKQDRTISAYILRAVISRINIEQSLAEKDQQRYGNYPKNTRSF